MKKDSYVTFFYLKIFLIICGLLLVGSLVAKVIYEVASSRFSTNSFSVLVVSKNSKLIFVDKAAKEALYISIGDIRPLVKGKNNLGASLALGVPVNGMIVDESSDKNLSEFASFKNTLQMVFASEVLLKNMNRFDAYKVITAINSTPHDNRVEERVDLTKKEDVEKIERHLIDSFINKSTYTIQIDNGTKINGLGGEVAKVLTKQGYNVVAVRNAQPSLTSYISYNGKRDAYINSLLGLTGFEFREEKRSPEADITIFLGDDLEAMLLP